MAADVGEMVVVVCNMIVSVSDGNEGLLIVRCSGSVPDIGWVCQM